MYLYIVWHILMPVLAKTNLIPILLNLARRISREQKTKQGTTCLWPPAWQVSYSGAHESDFRWQEGNSPSFEAQQDTGRLNKTVHSSRKLYCFQMDTSFLSAALRQRRDAGGRLHVIMQLLYGQKESILHRQWSELLVFITVRFQYTWSDVYALILIALLEESLLVLLVLNISDMKTLSIMLLISYSSWARHKWYQLWSVLLLFLIDY